MDNVSSHALIKELPYQNMEFVMLPPNCTVIGIKKPSGVGDQSDSYDESLFLNRPKGGVLTFDAKVESFVARDGCLD